MGGILKALFAAQFLFEEKLDTGITFDHDWTSRYSTSGPKVIKLFSYSTELSMKFQQLIKTKMRREKTIFLAFKLSEAVFIMLLNDKVGILTFMSMIKFKLS